MLSGDSVWCPFYIERHLCVVSIEKDATGCINERWWKTGEGKNENTFVCYDIRNIYYVFNSTPRYLPRPRVPPLSL